MTLVRYFLVFFIEAYDVGLFVCVEVIRPSKPNGVMSSAVSFYWAGLVL